MNYINVIDEIFRSYNGPKFSLKLWDNKNRTYGSGKSSAFTLVIKDAITVKKLLSQGSLGFGESYMDGSLDIVGNIESYMKLRRSFKKVRFSLTLALAKILANYTIPKGRKEQIAYHYDLGNDFFKLILDPKTMSYSAGLYKAKSDLLADAQQNKIDQICKWLGLPKNASVLDLGSGWGGFALHAAKKYQWHITGYTLSKAQLEYCQQLIQLNDLKKSVSFHYQDMLTDFPKNKFDGVAMIEAIEHVGQKNLPAFFQKVNSVIKKNAPFVLQLTGKYSYKRMDKWTLKYVFPGGYLPTKAELIQAAEDAGFVVEKFIDDTPDYIKTMTGWIKNLEKNQKNIEKMFDKKFYRLWYLWMHGAKVNFELKDMSLFRLKLRKLK